MDLLKTYFDLERTYTYGVPTHYNDFHLGVDVIVPEGTVIYAPCDGSLQSGEGAQGGKSLYFVDDAGAMIRVLHCLRINATGDYQEGAIIGWTGNTGLSTDPHAHIDVWPEGALILSRAQELTVDPDEYLKRFSLADWEREALEWADDADIIDKPEEAPFTLEQVAWIAKTKQKFELYLIDKYGLSNS